MGRLASISVSLVVSAAFSLRHLNITAPPTFCPYLSENNIHPRIDAICGPCLETCPTCATALGGTSTTRPGYNTCIGCIVDVHNACMPDDFKICVECLMGDKCDEKCKKPETQ